MCGSDDQAVDYFFWGVRAWLAGTANVLPREHVEVLAPRTRATSRALARCSTASCRSSRTWRAARYNQKAKLGLKHRGIDCGPVRMPLGPLDDAAAAEFLATLDAALR